MRGSLLSNCKGCGKELRWAQTASGQWLPIDPEPVPDGSVMLMPHGRCRIVPVEERKQCVVPLHKTHFATCPVAEEMRAPYRNSSGRPR